MMHAHPAHAPSLDGTCDSSSNHVGTMKQIRIRRTPPSRNGVSHACKTCNAGISECVAGDAMEEAGEDLDRAKRNRRHRA